MYVVYSVCYNNTTPQDKNCLMHLKKKNKVLHLPWFRTIWWKRKVNEMTGCVHTLGELGPGRKNENLSKIQKNWKSDVGLGFCGDRKENVASSESKWREMRFDKWYIWQVNLQSKHVYHHWTGMEKEGQHLHAVCSVRRNVGKAEVYCDGKWKCGLLSEVKCVILMIVMLWT